MSQSFSRNLPKMKSGRGPHATKKAICTFTPLADLSLGQSVNVGAAGLREVTAAKARIVPLAAGVTDTGVLVEVARNAIIGTTVTLQFTATGNAADAPFNNIGNATDLSTTHLIVVEAEGN